MSWNIKSGHATLRPIYPKKQSSTFLEQALRTTSNAAPQSFLNHPGSNKEACAFLSNSNPLSQPQVNTRHKTPQQMPLSDMYSETVMTSQTSVERITYTNVKGPKQLDHNFQISPGLTQNVWLNSPARNSVLSHTGTAVTHQAGFGTNAPSLHALQNQYITSDTYSVQLQMVPSNSVRVPVTFQGNQRLNPSLPPQGDWAQQHAASGLTYPDHRPLPQQYNYSRSCLQDAAHQKQNPMPAPSLQLKNSHPPSSALTYEPKLMAPAPSYHHTAPQANKRPPPPYECSFPRQPLQSPQHVVTHSTVDVPQSQESHLPELRKDFCRNFQQQWQNLNENARTLGNFCNLEVNANVSQPYSEPVRSSVPGIQSLAQNNQEKRVDSCSLPSAQVLDTSATKEKLVRDIKTLVEIKNKFSELARKIKIDKDFLVAAGCIKTTNPPYSDSAQRSELTLNKLAKCYSAPQVIRVTTEMVQDKPPTVMESTEQNSKTHQTLNSNTSCRKFNQDFISPLCVEKLQVPGQFHDLQGLTSLKTATVPVTPATSDNSQFSPGNSVNIKQSAPTNFETTSLPPSFEESVAKYQNKHPLILSLLEAGNKAQQKLLKDADKMIQETNLCSIEITPNTQVTGNQQIMKTVTTPSPCVNAKISDNSFSLQRNSKSPATGMSSQSEGQCSMELLEACLSLWKKQPSEPTEEKQHSDSRTHRTATGMSRAVEIQDKSPLPVVGNSETKMVNSLQETALLTVVQNYDSSNATVTKGTELQIAVVSPLILSDVKTLPVKEMAPGTLPETVYPVIKEGSVCSLQNPFAEDKQETATLKVNDPVANTTPSSKIFPLIQNEKQTESANVISEDTPSPDQRKYIKAEPDSHYPVTSVLPSGSGGGDVLQIDSICSLVEGDISYNSQIAKIFSVPPLQKVEPQKPLPSHQVVSGRQQKEQLEDVIEEKDFGFEKGNFEGGMGVSHEITDDSKSPCPESSFLKHVETKSEIVEQGSLEHITTEGTGDHRCPSAVPQKGGLPQDTPCSDTAQDPVGSEILEESTSVSYLHDQLSELLREFPFGIEAMNTCEGSVPQVKNEISKDQTCEKSACDSKDSTEQIQITVLSKEQMRELFPEQDDQPHEATTTEPQKEVPVSKEGSQSVPQAHGVDGDSSDCVIVDPEKDDVRCCALGWLSVVYKGIPQCQCHSVKNSTSEKEEEKVQCSPLETKDCKPGDRNSDQAVPVEANGPPDNNQKISVSLPVRKNELSEIEQGKSINQQSKTKHNDSVRTQDVSGQLKSDRKKDSSKSHKSRKLHFHEVTFHSSHKVTKPSQEKLQKKHTAPNPHLVQAKGGVLMNKEPHGKTAVSLAPQVSPEDRTLKAKVGDSSQKQDKRKLDEDSMLDSVTKKKKHEHEQQSKNVTSGLSKSCHPLSTSSERASVKEKTIPNVKTSSSTESSPKMNRLVTAECIQRQKNKEAMGVKVSKKKYVKSRSRDYQIMRSSKLALRVAGPGKSGMRHSSGSGQTSKEPSNVCTSLSKNLKIHHSEESKTYISKSIKGAVGGKPSDKMWIDKIKTDKNVSGMNSEGVFGQMSSHSKDQRKRYLNRVAFRCTERESICLTKLDSSPRKLGREKERLESKPKNFLPGKETSESRSMLEFKLCPDSMMKNASPAEDRKDLKLCPRKEQVPVQVSGIKSTKEDWLKCVTEEKRMPEANEDLDNNVLANSRHSKRSFSADGFDTGQNPVKDSKAMFQTYKKMYMEKRSRSLGSSPLK